MFNNNNKCKNIFLVIIILFICNISFTEDVGKTRQKIIESARSYLGTPYAWGGSTSNGMDCSGLVMTAVKEGSGISLPRTTTTIFDYVDIIPFAKVTPGDLLFFKEGSTISHVAIFIGGNEFIHSASDGPKTGVIISDLDERYWEKYFYATGKFLGKSETMQNSIKQTAEKIDNSKDTVVVPKKPSVSLIDKRPNSAPSNISFTYDNIYNARLSLAVDLSVASQLFDEEGYRYSNDLWSINAFFKIKALFDRFQVGWGIGILLPSMSNINKIPFFVTIGFPFGFSIDAGSYFLHRTASFAEELCCGGDDKYYWGDNPTVFVNLAWRTPSLMIERSDLSLVQSVIWAGEIYKKESSFMDNFLSGLSFSSGIRISIGI